MNSDWTIMKGTLFEFFKYVELDAYFAIGLVTISLALFRFLPRETFKRYVQKIFICFCLVCYFALRFLFAAARAMDYELETEDFIVYVIAFLVFLVPAVLIVLLKRGVVFLWRRHDSPEVLKDPNNAINTDN